MSQGSRSGCFLLLAVGCMILGTLSAYLTMHEGILRHVT